MKPVIHVIRVLVGILFIFSGLVKANDPLGLSYKMQEFFEVWSDGLQHSSFFLNHALINLFHFLHGHSLTLAVLMIAFEIIAGAALLFGWQMRIFNWLLLLLIIFFTFLTGYAFLSGKFKNCGCFGDCIPISPKASFLKDVALTILILILFRHRKHIQPILSAPVTLLSMLGVMVLSFGIQWYMLSYLPVMDCLAYKKGNNIPEKMKMPADAIPDSVVITFVYKKSGKEIEFTADKFPDDFDSTYQFVKRYDKVVRKGKNNEPPIKGFVLTGRTGEDSTQVVLNQPHALLLFCLDFSVPVSKWENDFSKLYAEAKKRNLPAYLITANLDEASKAIAGTSFADIPAFTCDFTAIRTAARTNPCLYLLKQGTIINKWSYKKMMNVMNQLPENNSK